MKFLVLILAIVAAVVWSSRIQKDLTTWRTSVETLIPASRNTQGVPPDPENVANLIRLLEHKPYRIALTPDEKNLLAQVKDRTAAAASPTIPTRPSAVPTTTTAPPVAAPGGRHTPTPQEAAAEIARKYGSQR
jgi:hypothetical protein